MNVTLAISPELGLVHHRLVQENTTNERFRTFLQELMQECDNLFPIDETVYIIYGGTRPHLNQRVPGGFPEGRFHLRMLPPHSPFLNPTEQAHSAFKFEVKSRLTRPEIQEEIHDYGGQRHQLGVNLQQWRSRILLRVARDSLGSVTVAKCQNWCGRVLRYIPACQNREIIQD